MTGGLLWSHTTGHLPHSQTRCHGVVATRRWAGAAYLIYLGVKLFTTKPDLNMAATQAGKGSRASLEFAQGFLISASNPKVILFYIAFLPTFMDLTVLSSGDIALASALTIRAMTG